MLSAWLDSSFSLPIMASQSVHSKISVQYQGHVQKKRGSEQVTVGECKQDVFKLIFPPLLNFF